MKKLIIFFVIVLITIISCKRWDCPEIFIKRGRAFNEEFISYFANFKDGSYWVYKDSISGTIDTLKLQNFYRTFGSEFPGDCEYHDLIYYDLIGSDTIRFSAEAYDDKDDGRFDFQNSILGVYIKYINNEFYAPGKNKLDKITSINVLGENYYNVIKYETYGYGYGVTIYFAPKIGLIQLDCIEHDVFVKSLKLISYEIR